MSSFRGGIVERTWDYIQKRGTLSSEPNQPTSSEVMGGPAGVYHPPAEETGQDKPVKEHFLARGLLVSENRHPSVRHMAPHFRFVHLPPDLQRVSKQFAVVGQYLVDNLTDNPELTEALRKLWEAKNCAVIQAGFMHGLSYYKPSEPTGY